MNKQGSAGSTATNAVRLHRVLAAKPDKVYRAFTTADAMARRLPPNGFTCSQVLMLGLGARSVLPRPR